MGVSVRLNFPHQPPGPQHFSPQQSGWGQTKPQTAQGMMGVQPPAMSKVPRPAMTPTPMIGQRLTVPQNYQVMKYFLTLTLRSN